KGGFGQLGEPGRPLRRPRIRRAGMSGASAEQHRPSGGGGGAQGQQSASRDGVHGRVLRPVPGPPVAGRRARSSSPGTDGRSRRAPDASADGEAGPKGQPRPRSARHVTALEKPGQEVGTGAGGVAAGAGSAPAAGSWPPSGL